MRAPTLTSVLVAVLCAAPSAGPAAAQEAVRAFDLLDNGDFAEELPDVRVGGVTPIPWWHSAAGAAQLEQVEGGRCLRTARGEYAQQAVPLYKDLARGLVLRGRVEGLGRITVQDGGAGRASLDVGAAQGGFVPFEWSGAQLAQALGRDPLPRLRVHLADAGAGVARWRDLELWVPLPAPTPAELRAEIVAELAWILELWPARGGDVEGEPTSFISHFFDVLTGERTRPIPGGGGHSTWSDLLFDAAAAAPEREDWARARDRAVRDVLERCVHPETGLPRRWDCARDEAVDDGYPEIAPYLGLLLEVAREGPPALRDPAREALRRASATVLATGLAPDGEVIARYRSRDGAPNLGYGALRRLDVPARLVGVWRLTGDEPALDAAREAVARFEYSHRWAGTWQGIDPAFDDEYGNHGARAVEMWAAAPREATFRRLALEGLEHFLPLWRDALRLGGNVAADQVRCWEVAAQVAALEPSVRAQVARLMRAAARVHVKGQQYDGGAWGDVTIFRFDPEVDLQVGDTFGPPQNLLLGLAVAHDPLLAAAPGGPDLAQLRALFTAVMRSTRETYRRPHGYLGTRVELAGRNESIGSIRVAVGLVRMLERL